MPPNPQNLRPPWPKGQSGNPGGKPKGRSVTSRLRELLDDPKLAKNSEDGSVILDRIAKQIIRKCLKGDHRFIETLLERTEGKVPVTIQAPEVDLEAVRDRLKAKRDERDAGSDRGDAGGVPR